MAQHRQRGFIQSSSFSRPSSLAFAVLTLLCFAASTTAQQLQQPPPLPLPSLPQPQTQPTMPAAGAAIPSVPVPACAPAQATLAPCWIYLRGNSSAPPTECCAQIKAMFESQAPCLCAAMAAVPVGQQLGSALGQMLPTSCDLPANACSGSGGTSGAAPADPTTTPASGTTTPAAAAPAATTEPNGLDDPTGGAGIKSLPGLVHSAAAAGRSTSGMSAAALFVSLLVSGLSSLNSALVM